MTGIHNVKHAAMWKAGIVRFYLDKTVCSAIAIVAKVADLYEVPV
jgi:hypothetical protein